MTKEKRGTEKKKSKVKFNKIIKLVPLPLVVETVLTEIVSSNNQRKDLSLEGETQCYRYIIIFLMFKATL